MQRKYRGLTYSAKQTVREICRATYIARAKLEFKFHLTVSITVVRSIETPKTTKKHPNHPNTPNSHQTPTITVYTRNII